MTPDDTYTHGHHASVVAAHAARTAANSAAYLLPHLRPGLDLLDVGCGPGTITVDLAAAVAPGRVVGIDRSADVVDTAIASSTERLTAAAIDPSSVHFRTGDLYALDEADDSYDVVHAHQVLQHVSDPVAALVEMRRVCRPGGTIAVRDADYGAFCWAPADDRLSAWLDLYRRVARSNDAEPDAGRHLKRWAIEAGCHDIRASASVWCFSSDDERAFWGGRWSERVLESGLATQALDAGLVEQDELQAMADAFRDWTDRPDGWFTVLHGEVLASP